MLPPPFSKQQVQQQVQQCTVQYNRTQCSLRSVLLFITCIILSAYALGYVCAQLAGTLYTHVLSTSFNDGLQDVAMSPNHKLGMTNLLVTAFDDGVQDIALSPKHKLGLTPSQFTDPEKGDKIGVGNAPFSNDPNEAEVERVRAEGRHRRRNEVPWAALFGFLICAAFLGVGMWLLFGTNGIQGGPK